MVGTSGRLPLYVKLVRLDKPIGILLLLWPTLLALWVAADGWPGLQLVIIFALGTALMRSAGCAINDYFDRDFDLHVERTRDRVLTSGKISPKEALAVAGGLVLVSALLILPLNRLVWILAVVAVFIAGTYPLMKRLIGVPQAYLGIAFGFGIPMAFAAVQETVPLEGWVMLAGNIAWAIAYDTEYAMVDRPDDLRIGIKTSAITFGEWDVRMVALSYITSLILFTAAGTLAGLCWPYYAGVAVASIIAVRHIAWIRGRDRAACFRAFLHNTWFGFSLFAGAVADTALRGVIA